MSLRDRWSFARRDRLIAAGQVPDVPPSDQATLTWVAPDGWPQPPEGWAPQQGWQPDSQWPAAPKEWVFWRPTSASSSRPRTPEYPAPSPTPGVKGDTTERMGDEETKLALVKVLDRAIARVNRAQDDVGRHAMVDEMDRVLESIPRWCAPEVSDPDDDSSAADFTLRDALQSAMELAGVGQADACVDLKTRLLTEGTDFRGRDFTLSCAMVEGANHRLMAAMSDRIGERTDRESASFSRQLQDERQVSPEADLAWVRAEQLAAAALRRFGFDDAAPTGRGADAGLDVAGTSIACQVKYTVKPVGRPVLQQLVGAAGGRVTAFFSRAGYSAQAIEYADQVGMALFGLTLPSKVSPQNSVARQMAS